MNWEGLLVQKLKDVVSQEQSKRTCGEHQRLAVQQAMVRSGGGAKHLHGEEARDPPALDDLGADRQPASVAAATQRNKRGRGLLFAGKQGPPAPGMVGRGLRRGQET